jgi:hypothetical protein
MKLLDEASSMQNDWNHQILLSLVAPSLEHVVHDSSCPVQVATGQQVEGSLKEDYRRRFLISCIEEALRVTHESFVPAQDQP